MLRRLQRAGTRIATIATLGLIGCGLTNVRFKETSQQIPGTSLILLIPSSFVVGYVTLVVPRRRLTALGPQLGKCGQPWVPPAPAPPQNVRLTLPSVHAPRARPLAARRPQRRLLSGFRR